MEGRLYEAAVEGNMNSLLKLLQEDALILDRDMAGSHAETPLHIAVMLGHLEFSLELLRRKPELAGELDSRRSSPLHLASARGYLEIAKVLVMINPSMCFACDRDGRNPVHVAVLKGRFSILKELVRAQPDAARARLDHGETILHLCVESNQLEALKLLVEILDDQELLNSKDSSGNTILHLAVADKQIQTIHSLLTSGKMEVNALNNNGFTAMDIILAHSRRGAKDVEIAECLQRAGGSKSADIVVPPPHPGFGSTSAGKSKNPKIQTISITASSPQQEISNINTSRLEKYFNKQDEWLDRQRNSLMVVASLIATMAFQAGIAPPGGFWQDDLTVDSQGNPVINPHRAGSPVLADQDPEAYSSFQTFNTTSLITSLTIILLLISGLPLMKRVFMWILMVTMWVTIRCTATTYAVSQSINQTRFGPNGVRTRSSILYIVSIWGYVINILIFAHTIRLVWHIIREFRRFLRKKRGGTSSSINVSTMP